MRHMDGDIIVDGGIVLLIAYYNNPQPRTMLFWYMFRNLGQNAYIVFALTLDRSVSALGLEMLLWTIIRGFVEQTTRTYNNGMLNIVILFIFVR